ncbi:hypothetical protein [Flavobacterium sp. FlaQc-48]|uniref:hypothetical protein n=1 Tax=Flavobacterium sp. FlaQc-48 TaxID=3374181 RepID=UPI0037567B85
MDENIITEFNLKLTDERLNGHHKHEDRLKDLYMQILEGMAPEFSFYRKYVQRFLESLETNTERSVSYSLTIFFDLYEKLIKTRSFSHFDLSVMDFDADSTTLEKMKPIFEASLTKNNQQRLSEDNFDISALSDDDKKRMAALIISKLQIDSKKINWSEEMVDITLMQLTFLRQILNSVNSSEIFYHSVGLFIDRLTSSEYYQAGRDIAEEVLLSSFKDNIPEQGFFNSFRLYSNIGSVNAALMYANLSLICILEKKTAYCEKYVNEIIWQGIKLFRNVKLYPWAAKLYSEIPVELTMRDYERRSLDHTYFTVLLYMMEPTLPSKLLEYMNKEREIIIGGGINEALPWLLTLYNIRRLYPTADFSAVGLGFYLNIFEMIVPADTIKKYKDIIEADSEDLKKHLKESLIKLNETRNTEDFVYDNESAIKMSNRLVEYSTKKKDAPAFLLSMMLKSDYSILFKPKQSKEIAPLILPDTNIERFNVLYEDYERFSNALPITLKTSLNWIALSEGNLFQLQLFNNEYFFPNLKYWNFTSYKKLLNTDYFSDLKFDDAIKDKGGVRLVSPEEFEEEENGIANQLNIAKLEIDDKAEEVFIVKDMELSNFPHNLFLNDKGNFIGKSLPITNVLSTEWLLQTKAAEPLKDDFSKSIWIPIESGDYALNYLYGNIEQVLKDHLFEVHQEVNLEKPLSSDINIVCSHGAKNISETQIMFQEDNPTYDLDSIIGKGKILIFFVCYSGSMKTEFFRSNVTSLIKRFIAQGYEAVIAPFWALDVTIPRYWLPEFLSSLKAGHTISQATFNANKKVYLKYPTPAAWACLHLYGNPNLKIEINSDKIAKSTNNII